MAFITANSRVKDILKGVFSKELVADHSHTSSHFPCPHAPKLCDSVNCHFFFLKVRNKLLKIQTIAFDYRPQALFVLYNEGDYPFSEIFWYVFGLVSRFIDSFSFSFFLVVQA